MEDEASRWLIAIAATPVVLVALLWIHDKLTPGEERELTRVRRRPIAELEAGQRARVVGRVRSIGELLRSPITGVPCVAYEALVEYRAPPVPGSRANASKLWHSTDGIYASTRFLVEDDSGAVIVDAAADDVVVVGADDQFKTVGDRRADVLELLSAHADTRLVQEHDFRYCEWAIEEGATVAVVGTVGEAVPAPNQVAGYRGEGRCRVLSGSEDESLYVSDKESLFR